MNAKLTEELNRKIAIETENFNRKVESLRKSAEKLDGVLERIKGVVGLKGDSFHISEYCPETVFLSVPSATKKEFSAVVRQLTEIFDEAPDTDVRSFDYSNSSTYTARFEDAGVYVSMHDPKDCKMIEAEVEQEVRSTRTVKKLIPHPACKAALKELE